MRSVSFYLFRIPRLEIEDSFQVDNDSNSTLGSDGYSESRGECEGLTVVPGSSIESTRQTYGPRLVRNRDSTYTHRGARGQGASICVSFPQAVYPTFERRVLTSSG